MFPATKIEIAQMAVSMVVAFKSSEVIEQQVVQHTNVDPDSITVKVGSLVAGHYAAHKAKPYTDEAVVRTASWLSSKFNKKQ